MLVVSRQFSESIKIGDDIVVTVIRIDHNKVRLGITAPRGVSIERVIKDDPNKIDSPERHG